MSQKHEQFRSSRLIHLFICLERKRAQAGKHKPEPERERREGHKSTSTATAPTRTERKPVASEGDPRGVSPNEGSVPREFYVFSGPREPSDHGMSTGLTLVVLILSKDSTTSKKTSEAVL